MDRVIRIIKETEHYAYVAPPNRQTTAIGFLDELEFLLASGYRPLFPIVGGGFTEGDEGIVCEKLEPPR